MKKLIILYKYIVAYRSVLMTVTFFCIGIGFYINYTQRMETLNVIGSKLSKVDNIDNNTTMTLELIRATKKTQDSMRIVIEHLPTGAPLHAEDITRVSSSYGYRFDPIKKLWSFHGAKDYSAKAGALVYATGAGVVIKAQTSASLGNYIIISNGYGYETTFGHLSNIKAFPGFSVKKGDPIAVVGNTGWSTGTHLHYVMKWEGKTIDPDKLMQL
jgi:murein DD-endopeptidase MepM/ murein hydrolase activator NlpD